MKNLIINFFFNFYKLVHKELKCKPFIPKQRYAYKNERTFQIIEKMEIKDNNLKRCRKRERGRRRTERERERERERE